MMLIPKENRIRDRKYLDSYRDTPCESCGRNDGTTVGAHVSFGRNSMGMKAGDDLTVGLCTYCHSNQEANPGAEWWMPIFMKLLTKRYEEWADG